MNSSDAPSRVTVESSADEQTREPRRKRPAKHRNGVWFKRGDPPKTPDFSPKGFHWLHIEEGWALRDTLATAQVTWSEGGEDRFGETVDPRVYCYVTSGLDDELAWMSPQQAMRLARALNKAARLALGSCASLSNTQGDGATHNTQNTEQSA